MFCSYKAGRGGAGRRVIARIRPIVICIVRRYDCLLVFEGRDSFKDQTFYLRLGGGIEFGEYGHEALVREMREEIGAELANVRFLRTLENIFTLEHELKAIR